MHSESYRRLSNTYLFLLETHTIKLAINYKYHMTTSVNVEDCWVSLSEQKHSSVLWLTKSHQSYHQVTAYRSCMSASSTGVTSRLMLTSINSEHTFMHSSYTNRRGIEKSLGMINTPSAIQLPKNLSCHLRSVISQGCLHNLKPLYSKLSCSSYSSQASPFTVIVHWKTVLVRESLSVNVTNRPHVACCCVKLQSRHMEYT